MHLVIQMLSHITLRPQGLQHSSLCPSLSPGVCSDSCLLAVSASQHARGPTSITCLTSRPTRDQGFLWKPAPTTAL